MWHYCIELYIYIASRIKKSFIIVDCWLYTLWKIPNFSHIWIYYGRINSYTPDIISLQNKLGFAKKDGNIFL